MLCDWPLILTLFTNTLVFVEKSSENKDLTIVIGSRQDLTAGHGEGSGSDLAVANGTGSGTAVFVGSGSGEGTGFLVGDSPDEAGAGDAEPAAEEPAADADAGGE